MRKIAGIPDDVFATPSHPLADLFPLMADDELKALADDIRKNGLITAIHIWKGQVLDGRNRLKACKLAGVEPRFFEPCAISPGHGRTIDQAMIDHILSLNLHRRHLTPEQKRGVIAAVLKADPSRSNRRVAGQTKADHKTVGKVREELEGRGEIPHVEERTDSKGRQQPAARVPLPLSEERREDSVVLLHEWKAMSAARRREALARREGRSVFNGQGDNESIEWALWSWNPVTGCLHDCPYCYARDIANRRYQHRFAPALYPSRLSAPRNTTFPKAKAAEWMGHKNVFVCSMADLFGRWVPKEWVAAVLDEVRAAGQWNFLFLTKFPLRLAEFDFPDNAWVGTTVDCQTRVANAEKAFRKVKAKVKWLSCEPLIEPLKFADLGAFDWLVIGGSSRSMRTPEWHPPRAWVIDLEDQAVRAVLAVYEKDNLLSRRRGYPGQPAGEPAEAPAALRYLPSVE